MVDDVIEYSLKEEVECKDIVYEQFVQDVADFSSQYGSDMSISYTAYNITGKPSKYPDYGDFPQTFVMRTYGNWWNEAPSRREEFMPQNYSKIISHDFIDVTFEEAVYPFRIMVYETYHPGSVVRIWAHYRKDLKEVNKEDRWEMLWEGEPQIARHARLFSPDIKHINFPTRLLRIEFDHTKLDYYTELDAVLLVGLKIPVLCSDSYNNEEGLEKLHLLASPSKSVCSLTKEIMRLQMHNIPPQVNIEETLTNFLAEDYKQLLKELEDTGAFLTGALEEIDRSNSGLFAKLPDETVLNIFSYLDLASLCQCAKVNRHFHMLATDSLLYTEINLKPYWHRVNDKMLKSLSNRCQHLAKLDLSWCGSYGQITTQQFLDFLDHSGKLLTHLRLDCCRFINDFCLSKISQVCKNIKELTLRNCSNLTNVGFEVLATLNGFERLDFYRTSIESDPLVRVLKASPKLKHINLGSCKCVSSMDEVAQALGQYNPELVTADFWKTYSLTPVGVRALSNCNKLEEIDFGWCLGVSVPGDCLNALAIGCPRLRKLFMAALRGILDRDLEPFVKHCPRLRQVDLLGVRSITADICLRFLNMCEDLRLLDVSFCDRIQDADVVEWRKQFPKVSIKRSFQYDCGAQCYLPNHH
uniref:F-box domain-containing protein n=1 Tax=Clastoptera arizonana TaxID=38151 RepID=A0A1B6DHT4_9HEMI